MNRLGVVLVVGLVALGVATPADAASTTVELEAAEDQAGTNTISFTFQAPDNDTVSVPSFTQAAGGDISYEFASWEGSDGSSGTNNQWTPVTGVDYTVTYDVTVEPNVAEGTYTTSVSVDQNGSSIQTEDLDVTVDVLEPAFGDAPSPAEAVDVEAAREGTRRVEFTVPIENVGDGVLVIDSLELSDLPDGITQASSNTGVEVSANGQRQLTVAIDIASNVSGGFYSFDATVTDTLGNQQTFSIDLDVDELFPEFGDVGTQPGTVTFDEPDEQSKEVRINPEFSNVGEGVLDLRDYRFEDVPRGFEVSEGNVPSGVIESGDSSVATFSVTVDDSVEEGTYTFTGVAEDNLGNTVRFPVEITVAKPPIVGFGDQPIDLGGVVVGRTTDVRLGIQEISGANAIEGLSVSVRESATNASLQTGVLEQTQVAAGGSTNGALAVSVDDDARQNEQLEWTLLVEPNDGRSVARPVTVTAEVLYPPELTELTAESASFTFDRQRPTDSYQTTTQVSFANSGDLEMTVTNVSANVQADGVSASVQNAPSTLAGKSSATAQVQITADDATPEGTYTLELTVETAEGGTETVTREVTVSHEVELTVAEPQVAFGELTVTSERTRAVELSEVLGYQDVENLEIERVSGPDRFVQVTDQPPDVLGAGETEQAVFTLQFGPEAELYRDYEWTFQVTGDRVEPQTITVTARPRPLSFDDIQSNLTAVEENGDWREPLAGGVSEMLSQLETQLRENDRLDSGTLPAALSTARSALLFADAMDEARQAQANENFTAAQRQIVRAAVARDQLAASASELPSSVRAPAESSATSANETLAETVATQRAHYREILSEEPPANERASAHRALARLATIVGDENAAARHRAAAEANTTQYLSLVANASQDRAEADTTWRGLRDNASVVVAGQPLVFNPARFDRVTAQLARIDGLYETAITDYRQAGANNEADAVQSRRSVVSGQATLVRYSLFGSIAVYGLVLVFVVGYVVRGSVGYVRDAKEAALGDFLL